jgi:hypothetical protein
MRRGSCQTVGIPFTLQLVSKGRSVPYNRLWRPRVGVEVWFYSFFDFGTKWGVVFPPHPQGKRCGTYCTGGWRGGRSGQVRKISPPPPNGIRSPDRPYHSESVYQLSYRGPHPIGIYICRTSVNILKRNLQGVAIYCCIQLFRIPDNLLQWRGTESGGRNSIPCSHTGVLSVYHQNWTSWLTWQHNWSIFRRSWVRLLFCTSDMLYKGLRCLPHPL